MGVKTQRPRGPWAGHIHGKLSIKPNLLTTIIEQTYVRKSSIFDIKYLLETPQNLLAYFHLPTAPTVLVRGKRRTSCHFGLHGRFTLLLRFYFDP